MPQCLPRFEQDTCGDGTLRTHCRDRFFQLIPAKVRLASLRIRNWAGNLAGCGGNADARPASHSPVHILAQVGPKKIPDPENARS